MRDLLSAFKGRIADEAKEAARGDDVGAQSLTAGFQVGEWTIEPLRSRVVSGDTCRHLEPRIMEVLVCLAENAGDVVQRESLLLRVWGERAVTDEPLTRCIAELRRALGDQRKNSRYIQTIPKRGYRLIAPVTVPRAGGGPPPHSWIRVGWPWVAAASALVLSGYLLLPDDQSPPLPVEQVPADGQIGSPSIAVLPFENRSQDNDMEYFSTGVSEDIINTLATIPDLRVTSRTSSFYFYRRDLDLPSIAEQLNVQNILEGSVRRQGDQIRVTVQLIDVETDTQIDAFRFDRPLRELFDVQNEIAAAVADRLRVSLGRLPDRVAPTQNMAAHQLYLQARFQSRKRTAESMNHAIELLQHAIEIDPGYAAAYEELASTLIALPGYSQRPNDRVQVSFPRAMQAAQRALELDPMLSKPHAVLAAPAMFATDYVTARQGLYHALSLAPNDPEVRIWFGMLLLAVGDHRNAQEQFEWAQRVDPLSGMTNGWMGVGLRRLGRKHEAESYLQTAMALGYVNALQWSALEHVDDAVFDESQEKLTVWCRSQGIDPEWARVFLAAIRNPARRDEAVEWIRRLETTHRDIGPVTYARIGALDEAFASAESAIAHEGALFFVDVSDSRLSDFRRDPRFVDLVRKTGLVAYWDVYGWNGYCRKVGELLACD